MPDKGGAQQNRRNEGSGRLSGIRSDGNHFCFLRYLLSERSEFGTDRPTHSCCPRHPSFDYLGANETTIFQSAVFFNSISCASIGELDFSRRAPLSQLIDLNQTYSTYPELTVAGRRAV